MSLEDAIRENTEAVRRLTDVMAGANTAPVAGTVAKNTAAPAAKPAATKAATAPVTKPVATKAAPALTYDDVKVYVLGIAKIDRTAATDLLTEFGVEKAPELTPDQYAPFIERAKVVQAELSAPKEESLA